MSARVVRTPLSVSAAYRALDDGHLGGVVLFVGRVRPDATAGGRVVALDYEAHTPVAVAALARLEGDARARVPGARVVVWHRVGRLRVGTPSVIVGVAAPHRAEAFVLARWLIDRLKRDVPIWKTDRVQSARRRRERPSPRGGR